MQSTCTLNPKVWQLLNPPENLEDEFIRSLPVSPILCRIILNRGITSLSEAHTFLNPDLHQMHDPSLMDGMDRAVERTRQALARGEKIMVHGDYDVDGITSTALLVRVLRILKADVCWYLPHRQHEGYDLGRPAIDQAKEKNVGLIITVDCGTSAVDAVEYAQSAGIDVIVTDHHEVGADLASAFVLVNPRKPGCPYPFKGLAGVGVAFKFAEALVRECGYDTRAYRTRFCDLAALGTVADIVPLLDENRAIVKFGIDELPRTGKKGIRALLDIARIPNRSITSHALAFAIAPRLNAAGRVDDAGRALELLITNDDQEAAQLAQMLDNQNKERQAEQERITKEALEQVASQCLSEKAKVLVLSSKDWHPGIIGIVASKVTDRYSRPSILIAMDQTGEAGVGSARSTAAFDVFDALTQCRHLLERCGGHARAAGLSINADKLSEFDTAINCIADELLTDHDLLPQLEIDTEISIDSITNDLASELELLEPHGHCNRQPVFLSRNVMIVDKIKLGSDGTHVKLQLNTGSGRPLECVAFGWGESWEAFQVGTFIDVCYNIRINQFRGMETLQAVLRDARPSEAVIAEPFPNTTV